MACCSKIPAHHPRWKVPSRAERVIRVGFRVHQELRATAKHVVTQIKEQLFQCFYLFLSRAVVLEISYEAYAYSLVIKLV